MLKTISLAISILLFTLSACTQAGQVNPSPTPTSGIEGAVTEGPMCPGPVSVDNNTCPDRPYQATITILNANNIQVTQVQSDASGIFKVALPPGTYTLQPRPGNPLPRAADQTVVVTAGQYTQVAIVYDTGMR